MVLYRDMVPPATFSWWEFEVLWSALGMGRPPLPLRDSDTELASVDREEIRSAVFVRLSGRGVTDGNRIHPTWMDRLDTLARPERSVDARSLLGQQFRALAATARGTAVLAVAQGDAVIVGSIREASLVASVVALLPTSPPGPGWALSLPITAVRRFLAADHVDPDADLRAAGIAPADAGLLLQLAEDRVHGGQFGVMAVEPDGRGRRRLPVVSWFDTSTGRYVVTTDGSTLTVAPADAARIAVRLHEILDDGSDWRHGTMV